MKTTKEVLQAVRDNLNDPNRWTKGTLARGKDGKPTIYHDQEACSVCLVGAIFCEVYGNAMGALPHGLNYEEVVDLSKVAEATFEAINTFTGYPSIPKFNDNPETEHSAVLSVLDRAIAAQS